MMNTEHRKQLPGTSFDYFDARAAVDAIFDALKSTDLNALARNG